MPSDLAQQHALEAMEEKKMSELRGGMNGNRDFMEGNEIDDDDY